MWYWIFKLGLFTPVVRVFFRPKVLGRENIPKQGAAILAANHLDAGDTFTLPAMMRRRLTYPAKRELFEGKGFRRRVVAWFLKAVGQLPLDRSGGRANANALGPAEQVLASGELVGIFPEGSRSPDGRLYKGHTGVARMALNAGVPVIPVGMRNTQLHKGLFGLPQMKKPVIIIGQPMDFNEFANRSNETPVLRWVTNEIMGAIQHLTGQEYVDLYPSRAKYGNLSPEELNKHVKTIPNEGTAKPEAPNS